MRRFGKRTRGSRAAAANRRVGVSTDRRARVQIGTTNGREWTRIRGLSIRVFPCRVAVMLTVLHVIGGSNNLEGIARRLRFSFGIQGWLIERVLHAFGSGEMHTTPWLFSIPLPGKLPLGVENSGIQRKQKCGVLWRFQITCFFYVGV